MTTVFAEQNKLQWCAMEALRFAVNLGIANEVRVSFGETIAAYCDPDSADRLIGITVTDRDLRRLDERRGEDIVRATLLDLLLAAVNPFAVGMA